MKNRKIPKMSDLHKLMNIIDENKEEINEGVYLKLCNALKKSKDEEEKNTKKFYKIDFVYTEPEIDDTSTYEIEMVKGNRILELSYEKYEKIRKEIEENCFFRPECDILCKDDIIDKSTTCFSEVCEECRDSIKFMIKKNLIVLKIEKA